MLITPGFRCYRRAADGSPEPDGEHYLNGDHRHGSLLSLVSDIYFEPVMGHTAQQVVFKILNNVALGRPALLETHRINFTLNGDQCAASMAELRELLTLVSRIPDIAFTSSQDLGQSYDGCGPVAVDTRVGRRLGFALRRMLKISRFRKIAWIMGLVIAIYPAMHLFCRSGTVGRD